MALSVSVIDYAYVRTAGEKNTVGIGWAHVAEEIDVSDYIADIMIGNTRDWSFYSEISVDDEPEVIVVICAWVIATSTWTPRLPVRYLSSSGASIVETGRYTYIPVRELVSSGVIEGEGLVPVREFAAEVLSDWPATVEGRISVRTLESYKGAEQSTGKIPERTISSSVYSNSARVSGYVPVREGESALIVTDYATLSGIIPVRSIAVTGHTNYLVTLSKSRPCWTGTISASQDYSVTVSGMIPIRTLESDPYENGVSLTGHISPRIIGLGTGISGGTGEGNTVTETIPATDGDYILKYVRP